MQVLFERCCGMDVHKKTITACMITPDGEEVKTFGTMTIDILRLVDWLKNKNCTNVAMESTGVYWKPIYNLLELEEIEAMVVNAKHLKAVPGRKTDANDAIWIADLLQHGLLRGSFIPDRPQRELRELVRYRRSLINERSREVNRIQKVLEGCNIKLSSVATDIMGVSGRAMIEAMIKGIDNPDILAGLAKGKLRNKTEDLKQALFGLIKTHQKMLLRQQLEHVDFLDKQIASLDQEIEKRMHPFKWALELLDTIPGVGRRTAEQLIAEIGVDMSRFPTAAHLAAWAGIAPGNNESAGKRKSGRTRKGNKHMYYTLAEAGNAAAHTKDTYLSAQYHRIAARRGRKRAAVAVGHSILVMAYHMLKNKQPYIEHGANYFDKLKKEAVILRTVKRLEALGYKVKLEQVA